MAAKLTKEVLKQLNEAWLKTYCTEEPKYNPLDILRTEDNNEFEKKLVWLLTQPDYFAFLVKYIFNIELLPFQVVILTELWKRKFPMLIATRGGSKATTLDTPVLTNRGFVRMGDINLDDKVYGRDGLLHNITGIHPQGKKRVYRVKTLDNRFVECCEDHLWVVKNQKREIVISTGEMYKAGVKYINKRDTGVVYKFKIPNSSPLSYNKKELPIDPYILGCLLGDGCMSTLTPCICTTDDFIAEEFQRRLPDFKIEKEKTGCSHTIVDVNKDRINVTNSRGTTFLMKTGNRLTTEIRNLGLNVTCRQKFIPEIYKQSSYEDRIEMIRGLMDTDGSITKCGSIEFTNTCERLVDDVIEILRSLGISCIKSEDNRTGQSHDIKGSVSLRTRCFRVYINTDVKIFNLPRKVARLSKSTTSSSKYVPITEIELTDKYDDMQCISVDSEDHTYITKDYLVTHNSFLLALYGLMRCLVMPNRKVIVAGAAFRQSRFVHEYMETIWKNAPILRDLCDQDSGATRSTDMCRMTLNGSSVTSIPIGTGEKIRGYRCQDLLAEEFGCLLSDTYIQTDEGIIQIKDYLNGNAFDLINMDGELESPDKIFKTPKVDVYKVSTINGYSFQCSSIHQVMTQTGWKLAKDLTIEDNLILDVNKFFPDRYLEDDGNTLDEKMGWLIGLLISEGTVTNRNYLHITNTDKELIDKILSDFSEIPWATQERPAYVDKRGFNCKTSWQITYSNTAFRSSLLKFGVTYDISLNKTIPSGILRSKKSVIISFLSGLFEGDGSCYNYDDSGKMRIGITYYSGSENLCDGLQILLLKFGITCSKIKRQTNILSKNRGFMLNIRGQNAFKLFKLINVLKWKDKFDSAYFYERKPSINVVTKKTTRYNLSTTVGNKNKHIGAYSSREEAIEAFNIYIENERPVFRVKTVELLPEKQPLYDFHMPKTHSFIGNGFIQHNSHTQEIFETVLAGFGNVSASPSEVVKNRAAKNMAKQRGIAPELLGGDPLGHMGNQIVICGTATYDFNHFATYWKKYKKIIHSKGSQRELDKIFPEGTEKGFDYRDYSIIRLPYEALPEGFLDEGNVARSKASVHSGIFSMEFSGCFAKDSKGFFKRSMLEKCVANATNEIQIGESNIVYDALIKGNANKRYVIGVDPASEIDNFCIVVIELYEDHRRIVHCWTTTRESHKERVNLGLTTEDNFYSYCARRIRDLMRIFPTERIMMDSQGGGIAVSEALHETSNLAAGELPVWPIIDENKEKDTDDNVGLHLIEMVNFAKAELTSEANHGMRKDFEDRVLLFPKFDPIVLGIAAERDALNNRLYDTLEDCVMEIEEMKNELVLIEITQTATGRDKWDTPEIKVTGNKKGKMRKDRYSALVMANMGARNISLVKAAEYMSYGGFAELGSVNSKMEPVEFIGPSWFTQNIRGVY